MILEQLQKFPTYFGWAMIVLISSALIAVFLNFILRVISKNLWNNLVATHTLVKIQGVFANRRYLKFVWDSKKHQQETKTTGED